ncbi:MAG: sigma-70 family RNA polymerase sigma factor [Sphaerospermopsis sp. SIO1G2]|nr:sigma-70 family RNA polymerase sigma factor [Sphaerospermopsis sp. SIO1G2]
MTHSLEVLMQSTQSGDKHAYALLLKEAKTLINRYLYKRVSVQEDIPDIAQEILLSIHKARHTYQPEKPFTPWLYAICNYRLSDYLRRTYRSKEDACDDFSMVIDHLSTAADDKTETRELLTKVLSCLNEKQRTIIKRLYFQEDSAKEVAEQLHISVTDVRTSAHRAMKRLRHEMEKLQ